MGGYTFAAAATALSACAAAGFESALDSGFGLGLKKAEIGVTAGAASSAGFGPGLKKAEIVPFDIGVGVGSRGLSRAREGRGEITFQLVVLDSPVSLFVLHSAFFAVARPSRSRQHAPVMQALAMALAAGGGGDSDGMSERDAAQLCTTLRSMASTICDSLTKRLQSQLGEPGGGDRSLDKSGEQVQAEALQLCCLMTGRGGEAEAGRKLVTELEAHAAAVPEVAAFLRYVLHLHLQLRLHLHHLLSLFTTTITTTTTTSTFSSRYWAQLSLMAGVVAPNAGQEVHTAWSDLP